MLKKNFNRILAFFMCLVFALAMLPAGLVCYADDSDHATASVPAQVSQEEVGSSLQEMGDADVSSDERPQAPSSEQPSGSEALSESEQETDNSGGQEPDDGTDAPEDSDEPKDPDIPENPDTPKEEPDDDSGDDDPANSEQEADGGKQEDDESQKSDLPSSTTLRVSIYWIDGNNYYGLQPGAVTFTIQRCLCEATRDNNGLLNGHFKVKEDWEDVPLSWYSSVTLTSGDGWADKYLIDIPFHEDDMETKDDFYAYRAVESIYNFAPFGRVPADAFYEYRNYSVNSYDDDDDSFFNFTTRCVNVIRIYSVPTGDSFSPAFTAALCTMSLCGVVFTLTKLRKKKPGETK